MAGFGLNLKLVLYLQSQLKTESLGFLNPPLLQAAKRWQRFLENEDENKNEKIYEIKYKTTNFYNIHFQYNIWTKSLQ